MWAIITDIGLGVSIILLGVAHLLGMQTQKYLMASVAELRRRVQELEK